MFGSMMVPGAGVRRWLWQPFCGDFGEFLGKKAPDLQSASSLALVNAFRVVHLRNRLKIVQFSHSMTIYLGVFGEVIYDRY